MQKRASTRPTHKRPPAASLWLSTPAQVKLPALNKVLRTHNPWCTYHVHTSDRHCSCGRNQAIEEVTAILQRIIETERACQIALPLS